MREGEKSNEMEGPYRLKTNWSLPFWKGGGGACPLARGVPDATGAITIDKNLERSWEGYVCTVPCT